MFFFLSFSYFANLLYICLLNLSTQFDELIITGVIFIKSYNKKMNYFSQLIELYKHIQEESNLVKCQEENKKDFLEEG